MRNVKSRPGTVRAERAATTRRRIEDAARVLFVDRGYGATTLREIADAAGVAVQTIYAVYGSKASILGALREAVRNDAAADEAFLRALAEQDPERALALFAHSVRLRWDAGHDIVTTHVEAASVDPGVRADLAALLGDRRRGITRLARSVAGRAPLAGDTTHVAAILDALTLPEVYAELTGVHGWAPDAYERWLAAALFDSVQREGGRAD